MERVDVAEATEEWTWPSRESWQQAFKARENRCPWPGPRPLAKQDEDEHVLIGRVHDIQEFVARVEFHRLVQLTGVSGVGKSSLLTVGLAPALSRRFTVLSCRDWNLQGAEMFDEYLAAKLHSSLPKELKSQFDSDPELFYQLADLGDRAVVVLDQFEEVLRQEADSQEDALDFLYALLTNTPLKIVLSYRSEYARQLHPLERRNQRQWSQSHYELAPLAAEAGMEIIRTPRRSLGLSADDAIAPDAAELIFTLWQAARLTSSRAEIMVGPLHLQALLFALWDAGGRRRVGADDVRLLVANAHTVLELEQEPTVASTLLTDWASNEDDLARVTTTEDQQRLLEARGELRKRLTPYRVLMEFALQESAVRRLVMAEAAAHQVGMDDYLVTGIASRLISIVPHLSSGTYKLDRQIYDLASTVLTDQIGRVADDLPGAGRDRFDGWVSQLVSDHHWRRLLLSVPRRQLLDDIATADADDGGILESLRDRDSGLGCGPLRGEPDLDVLIEELRRFVWAVAWLHDLNIARTKDSPGGQTTVSLIHDGFGPAMIRWRDRYRADNGAWVLHAITAPQGEEHRWGTRGRSENQELLSGSSPTDPAVHANLVLKGNAVLFAQVRNAVFVNCDLRGVLFFECQFESVTLLNCALDGALFSDCTIVDGTGSGSRVPLRDHPVEEQPQYVLAGGTDKTSGIAAIPALARVFARYRERGETGSSLHVVPPLGAAAPIAEPGALLPWTPPDQGLVIEGGRVSAVTFRGTSFRNGATIRFKRVRGSGVDIAELHMTDSVSSAPEFEFSECALRHVAFTAAQNAEATELDAAPSEVVKVVTVTIGVKDSAVAQWWVGGGIDGELTMRECLAGQLWIESDQFVADVDDSSAVGLIRVGVGAGVAALPWKDSVIVPAPAEARTAMKFRDRLRRMDYRRE